MLGLKEHTQIALNESFVIVTEHSLQKAMCNDAQFKTFITMPAKELPVEYRQLVVYYSKSTLLNLIETSMTIPAMTSQLSVEGNKVKGFVAYQVLNIDGVDRVGNLIMFSVDRTALPRTLRLDLESLLRELLLRYQSVSWDARSDNKANSMYKRAIKRFGGTYSIENDITHYHIEKQ